MDPHILTRAGIDPRTVLHVEEVRNVCPWCFSTCGTLGCLLPCKHKFCDVCLASIVDSEYETCPVCNNIYDDYTMDTTTLV